MLATSLDEIPGQRLLEAGHVKNVRNMCFLAFSRAVGSGGAAAGAALDSRVAATSSSCQEAAPALGGSSSVCSAGRTTGSSAEGPCVQHGALVNAAGYSTQRPRHVSLQSP